MATIPLHEGGSAGRKRTVALKRPMRARADVVGDEARQSPTPMDA
jgi:hypothetical protein